MNWKSISSKAGAWVEMLELLVPNAAKATMAEEHKFLESGNWEKATSIARSNAYSGGGPAWHQLSQGCPAALPSTDAVEASCISNPKGTRVFPGPRLSYDPFRCLLPCPPSGQGSRHLGRLAAFKSMVNSSNQTKYVLYSILYLPEKDWTKKEK